MLPPLYHIVLSHHPPYFLRHSVSFTFFSFVAASALLFIIHKSIIMNLRDTCKATKTLVLRHNLKNLEKNHSTQYFTYASL